MRANRLGIVAWLGVAVAAWITPPALADEALWTELKKGGQVVLIRHASTVAGVGDPPGFRLDDCATQRNLSDEGRAEARRIGEAFRARGVPVGEVLSSQWCRCVETATLAFGRAAMWPALNSNFNDTTRSPDEKVREVKARLATPVAEGNLILVTHNFNIRDITGIGPMQGEMVIVAPAAGEGLRVLGRIPAP